MGRTLVSRIPLPGFPWEGRFETRAEVDTYLADERLTCLLCGRRFRTLPTHIRLVHGIHDLAYRERFGLPRNRGLATSESRAAYLAALLRRDPDAVETIRQWGLRVGGNHNVPLAPQPPFTLREGADRIRHKGGVHKISGVTGAYADSVWAEFLARIAIGRTAEDVGRDFDMPNHTTWATWKAANRERVAAFYETLPFAQQARAYRLGARFAAEVRRRFDAGETIKGTAKALGVSHWTVRALVTPWRKARKALRGFADKEKEPV